MSRRSAANISKGTHKTITGPVTSVVIIKSASPFPQGLFIRRGTTSTHRSQLIARIFPLPTASMSIYFNSLSLSLAFQITYSCFQPPESFAPIYKFRNRSSMSERKSRTKMKKIVWKSIFANVLFLQFSLLVFLPRLSSNH